MWGTVRALVGKTESMPVELVNFHQFAEMLLPLLGPDMRLK